MPCISNSWKEIDKILTYFGDPLCFCFFIAHGVKLDNEVDPPMKYPEFTLSFCYDKLNTHSTQSLCSLNSTS